MNTTTNSEAVIECSECGEKDETVRNRKQFVNAAMCDHCCEANERQMKMIARG